MSHGFDPRDPQRRVTRRDVLAGLAAVSAIAATPAGASTGGAERRSAVVIGAGIAGLSAAYELRKAGWDVAVFEKWEFVGGRMRDAWMGPIWGPPHALGILEANREMFALGAELGISDQLAGDAGSDEYIVDNGVGVYPTALRFRVEEVQNIPGMSAETRRRLPVLQADLDRMRQEVDPCLMTTGAAEDDESLGQYYERLLGPEAAREVMDYWVDVVLNAWGWPYQTTSKMALLPWFAQQQARVVVPRGGIGVLTTRLGEVLPVQTRTSVRYITPPDAAGRHTIHYLTPDQQARSVKPDVVVCATEGKYVPSLVQGLSPSQQGFFKSIEFTKGGGVNFLLKRGHEPPQMYGAAYTPSHPDPVKRRVSYWYTTPGDPAAKGQPARVYVVPSRLEMFRWQASNQSMPDYVLPLAQHFYPWLTADAIEDVVVTACDDLIYIPVGYIKQAAQILREQEQGRRGLYFAGEYMAGAHTGAACASGRTVARKIVEHWR